MKRSHSMPFGTECCNNGGVRFRLWAPKAGKVDICLEGNESSLLPMRRKDGGWFELTTGTAAPGATIDLETVRLFRKRTE